MELDERTAIVNPLVSEEHVFISSKEVHRNASVV